jgi:WXG100 family type VII secretion target
MTITSSFQTEVATMEVAARRVDEVANAIEAELRALDNRIQPITSTWRGAAATAYLTLHEKWTTDATKLRQVLAEISLGLGQNATRYQTNEDQVASQMARTAGSL